MVAVEETTGYPVASASSAPRVAAHLNTVDGMQSDPRIQPFCERRMQNSRRAVGRKLYCIVYGRTVEPFDFGHLNFKISKTEKRIVRSK